MHLYFKLYYFGFSLKWIWIKAAATEQAFSDLSQFPPLPVSLTLTRSFHLTWHHTGFLSLKMEKWKTDIATCFKRSGRIYHCGRRYYYYITNNSHQPLMHTVFNVHNLRRYYEANHSKKYDQNSKDLLMTTLTRIVMDWKQGLELPQW